MTPTVVVAGDLLLNFEGVSSTLSNGLFVVGNFRNSSTVAGWHLIKYDKYSGAPLVYKNYLNYYNGYAMPKVEVDDGYVYFSMSTEFTAGTPATQYMHRLLYKYDDDLVLQKSIRFFFPVQMPPAVTSQCLDQEFSTDYIFEYYSAQSSYRTYLIQYNKTDLTLVKLRR
jgi:hypothetical protein